jgi:hypothetical protein
MPIARRDRILHVGRDIVSIFTVRQLNPRDEEVLTFEGTGFLVAPHALVTCWHCVRRPLAEDERYAVIFPGESDCYGLSNIEQHRAGLDLATATVESLVPTVSWSLATDAEVMQGREVWSYGYPLGVVTQRHDGWKEIDVSGRYLRGYVTRTFTPQLQDYGRTPTIELDMPAPAGLSGAPLVLVGRRKLVGVVYGSHAVSQVEELARYDPETGEKTPEVHRLLNFAVAHAPSSLHSLTGMALSGRPLSEWLDEAKDSNEPR